ncbi:MAG: universal stress protein [Ignavibacteriales bacterium]|nr:MAG: universal stress protein [Ignavibacteriales bacterium]
MSNKNILTPVDFSVNSIQALDFAVQYSRQHKATLHLLHVIDPAFHEKGQRINDDFIMMERLRNANEELKKFVNEIPHPGVEIIENLKIGDPHKEIIVYASKNNINLIVISSHGWTARYNLATGKVAEYIIENSPVPVICLRADKSLKKHNAFINNSLAENWVG